MGICIYEDTLKALDRFNMNTASSLKLSILCDEGEQEKGREVKSGEAVSRRSEVASSPTEFRRMQCEK